MRVLGVVAVEELDNKEYRVTWFSEHVTRGLTAEAKTPMIALHKLAGQMSKTNKRIQEILDLEADDD